MTTRSIDDTVHFVNGVITFGTINSVINLDLGTLLTLPPDSPDKKPTLETVISCRLRMDIECARQIVKVLSARLSEIDDPKHSNGTHIDASPAPEGLKAN